MRLDPNQTITAAKVSETYTGEPRPLATMGFRGELRTYVSASAAIPAPFVRSRTIPSKLSCGILNRPE